MCVQVVAGLVFPQGLRRRLPIDLYTCIWKRLAKIKVKSDKANVPVSLKHLLLAKQNSSILYSVATFIA